MKGQPGMNGVDHDDLLLKFSLANHRTGFRLASLWIDSRLTTSFMPWGPDTQRSFVISQMQKRKN
jgi:hypothetical protein